MYYGVFDIYSGLNLRYQGCPTLRNSRTPQVHNHDSHPPASEIIYFYVSICGSAWRIANAPINNTYRAFSKEKIIADIGVYVGLKHVNITLQAVGSNWTTDVDFNERFLWLDYNQMGNSFREALVRGLPFPILTVAEYFTIGQEGLAWGGQYRAAGYFATIMLWLVVIHHIKKTYP
ncbi:hypothetical protein NQ317_009301 [Molorchus minor]|uniref:Uncharacterized protein n=1 Tax=Molorchus minor TaxID=1323400 RepID=A0ABQ9IV50_9CUCU|nr:hypothetical protein NQ317_009301 [Molorchus minor]